MDGIEKVAMEMHRIACGQFHRPAQELWEEAHAIDRAELRVDARHLIEAFPQLGVEAREEWGVQEEGEIPAGLSSKESAETALQRSLAQVDDQGKPYDDRLVRRMVWTGEWEGVNA